MSVFVTFRHAIMLYMKVMRCTWCSFHELVENRELLHTVLSRMHGAVTSVDLAVRYVLQLKYKRAMKVRCDA